MIRYDRRRFLSSLGLTAGTAALPAIADRLVSRAYGQESRKKMLALWVVGGAIQCQQDPLGWGLVPPEFSETGGSELNGKTSFTWPAKLAPLQGMRDKVVILDGLNSSPGLGGHGNGYCTLTCTPGSDSPGGPSIDQAIAQVIGRDTALSSILIGVSQRSLQLNLERQAGMFAAARGSVIPLITSVPLLLRELFGTAASGGKPPSPRPLLDSMRLDIQRLERKLAVEERGPLQDYLRLISQFEAQYVARSKIVCNGPATLPAGSVEDITTSMVQAATLALQCGISRVVGIAIGATGGDHEDMPAHQVLSPGEKIFDGHGVTYNYSRQAGLIQRFHMSLIADMHKALGDGLLSVYTSESGAAGGAGQGRFDHHAAYMRTPAIVVGTAGGALRTGGRYLRYPLRAGADAQVSGAHAMADLFMSVAGAMDAPLKTFGGGPMAQPPLGPLPELLA